MPHAASPVKNDIHIYHENFMYINNYFSLSMASRILPASLRMKIRLALAVDFDRKPILKISQLNIDLDILQKIA